MSLFARTALSLIIGALLIAALGSAGLRYFVHRQIRREVDGQLRHNWRRMAANLAQRQQPLTQLVGVFEIWRAVPVSATLTLPPSYRDTMEVDLVNGEQIPVRLLKQTYTVGGQRYLFTLRQPYEEFEEIAENVTVAVVVCFLGLVLLLILTQLALYRHIWRPFYLILEQLRTYQLDQAGTGSFVTSYIREFNRLSTALNQMVRSSRQQYHLQKQFTENAAHELQTPLAIATTELEQLEQSERLSETDWKHLDRASQALGRLTNLSRSLLLLTKIETQQYAEAEPVDLSQLLCHLIDTYDDFARHKRMVIEPMVSPGVVVKMNRQLAEVMVANLLKNAIRHGQADQPIQMRLTPDQLSFINAGDPLPFPPEQLFDRFVKNTANFESTGLGLALVKQIADRYQLLVAYSYDATERLHRFNVAIAAVISIGPITVPPEPKQEQIRSFQ
jgi:signal transduction histidine kinase